MLGIGGRRAMGGAASSKAARLPGAAGAYFSTPDSVAASITGDIDIRVLASLTDWTPATDMALLAKQGGGTTRSYSLVVLGTSGNLAAVSSPNGTDTNLATSTASPGFVDGTRHWVRFTRVAATGVAKFYTSENGSTWTQLGTDVATSAGSVFDTNVVVEVGATFGGTAAVLTGSVYRAQVYSGVGGTLAVDFDPNDWGGGTTWLSRTTGETWTINGTATVVAS